MKTIFSDVGIMDIIYPRSYVRSMLRIVLLGSLLKEQSHLILNTAKLVLDPFLLGFFSATDVNTY